MRHIRLANKYSTDGFRSQLTWALLFAAFVPALAAPRAEAIDIDLIYDEEDTPGYDADGSRLMDTARAAAEIWERNFDGGDDYTFSLSWDGGLDNSTAGETGLGVGIRADGYMDFNTNLSFTSASADGGWYIDASPLNNSEFDFTGNTTDGRPFSGTTFYQDLSSSQQSDWFDGNPPELLETGYRGVAPASASNQARQGLDLLSTILHEMGHALGVNNYGGRNYTFYPNQVGGNNAGVEEGPAGHIAPRSALILDSGAVAGDRRLPSAVDVLSVAQDEDYRTEVDLDRKYFIGDGMTFNGQRPGGRGSNTDWHEGFWWLGGEAPEFNDDAFILSPNSRLNGSGNVNVSLDNAYDSADGHARNLTLGVDANVDTGTRTLDVEQTLRVGAGQGGYGEGSTLRTGPGGGVQARDLILEDDATLDMSAGSHLLVDHDLDNAGLLRAAGEIEVGHRFVNDGKLRLDDNAIITHLGNGGRINLDGAGEADGNGAVIVLENQTLSIDAPLTDAFNGTIDNYGGTIKFLQGWTLAISGQLTLEGTLRAGTSHGGTSDLRGEVEVYREGTLRGPVVFRGNDVELMEVYDDAASLTLDGPTTFDGANLHGPGTITQNGDVQVNGETTIIDTDVYDWDGDKGDTTTTLADEASLVIRSNAIDTAAADGFDGTLRLGEFASVRVEKPDDVWRLEGDARLDGGARIEGAKVDLSGKLTVNDVEKGQAARINTSLHVAESGTLHIFNQDKLNIDNTDGTISNGLIVDGTLKIEDASLNVQNKILFPTYINPLTGEVDFGIKSAPWLLRGTAELDPGARIGGSTLRITDGGAIQIDTTGPRPREIDADTIFDDGAKANIDYGRLNLLGDVTSRGASFTGTGKLGTFGDFHVIHDTTVDVGIFNWDGGQRGSGRTTIDRGATLTVRARHLQPNFVGESDQNLDTFYGSADLAGTLDIDLDAGNTLEWTNGGSLHLKGGTVTGDVLRNVQRISGHGTINTLNLINNGVLDAYDGTLDIRGFLAPPTIGGDDDGIGEVRAINGDVNVGVGLLSSRINFDGRLIIGDGHRLHTPGNFHNRGRTTLRGGRLETATLTQAGRLAVTADSAISGHTDFLAAGTNQLDAALRLEAGGRVRRGAQFTGAGSLVVTEDTTLRLDDGAELGTALVNHGEVSPGASPGVVELAQYEQDARGVLLMEIAEDPNIESQSPTFDQLRIAGEADLAGTLEVSILDEYMPGIGDQFDLLTFGSKTGRFDQILLPSLSDNLSFATTYQPHSLTLRTIPEPSTLMLLSMAGLLTGRRRRSHGTAM